MTWWCMHLIQTLWRQRQGDLCEFEANLIYKVSSKAVKVTQRNSVSNLPSPPKNMEMLSIGLDYKLRWLGHNTACLLDSVLKCQKKQGMA